MFKVGDSVYCIDDACSNMIKGGENMLVKDNIYTINNYFNNLVTLVNVTGCWYKHRFILKEVKIFNDSLNNILE
jgi:hypothetical protein